ncbi:MAG: hypothetical protein V7636_1629 [Actinomycetota bacterium]
MGVFVGPKGAGSLEEATGWAMKPEGLCRDDICVLVPDDVRGDPVALWDRLGWPAVSSGEDAYLGEAATARADALVGTIAPDFTLRDLNGVEHSLSDHRGKKVFVASWAPW